MRALRLTTGLTSIRFGTNDLLCERMMDAETSPVDRILIAMANDLPINKAEIRTLIPHSGLMCLLDEVTQWDDRSIVCITNTHRDPDNPLLREGRLSALHAFEYGAQAAAVHGGLRARSVGTTAAPGYLAALRNGRLHIARLDHIHLPLRICATRLFGDRANTVYECLVSAASILVAEGRIIIMERT